MNKRIQQAYRALARLKGEDLSTFDRDDAQAIARSLVALAQGAAQDWTKVVHPEVSVLAGECRLIQAIKKQRELTGMALKDAKDFVERHFPATVWLP